MAATAFATDRKYRVSISAVIRTSWLRNQGGGRADADKEQHAATELIAAEAVTTSHDLLSPSERLENAIDNRDLTELRW